MLRMLHCLIMMAVILCGLHLSPAEAGVAHPAGQWTEHAPDRDGGPGDHDRPHAAHACHSHCPVALDEQGTALRAPASIQAAPVAAAARILSSRSQAPPLEPPSA